MTAGRINATIIERRYKKSFNKNSSRATTHMPILRKVHLCNVRCWIEKGADALDRFESDVGNILRPQPFQNRSALKRDGQAAQFSHVEMAVAVWGKSQLSVDPVFFVGCDSGRAPNAHSNLSAELLLDVRNDALTNSISQRREIFVGSVLAES